MSILFRRLTQSLQWASLGVISVAISFVAMAPIEAEAKRMGGGSSFGRQAPVQRQAPPSKPAPTPAQQPGQPAAQPAAAPAAAPTAAAAPARSSWMGPVAGLAAGLGLAALASYLGFGEELMSMLLIVAGVLLAVFLFRLVMARGRQAQPAGAHGAPVQFRETMQQPAQTPTPAASTVAPSPAAPSPESAPSSEITESEVERFLSVAREQFLHLQKVWDEGRLEDIRAFTTEGMAEGLRQQLFQRGPSANVTTVDELHVEWFGQSRDTGEDGQPVDAVFIRFHGQIREAVDALPTHFDETWTLHKSVGQASAGWLLAGITQNQSGA